MLGVKFVHAPRIEKDDRQKDEDRSLLREPKPQIGTANHDARKHRAQQNAKPERNDGPNDQADENDPQVCGPVAAIG